MAHGNELHQRMEVTQSPIAGAVSNGLAEAGLPVKHGLHGAVFGKDAVFGSSVPIDLAVKVVASQALRGRFEIVSCVASPSRRRNQSQDFRRNGADRYGCLIGKGGSSSSVRVSGGRVIDNCPRTGEVSGSKGGSRHGLEAARSLAIIAFEGSVVAAKEEELVLLNGPTEGAAEVIQDALAISRAVGWGPKELPCSEGLVLMVFKQDTVELVGAGLGDDRNGCAAGHPLFRIEIIRGNVHFLD